MGIPQALHSPASPASLVARRRTHSTPPPPGAQRVVSRSSHMDAGKAVSCHSHIACSTHFSSCRPVYSAVDLTSSRGRRSVVRARKVYAFALDICSACCPTGVTHSGRRMRRHRSWVEQSGTEGEGHRPLCAISERVRNWSKRTLAVLELGSGILHSVSNVDKREANEVR